MTIDLLLINMKACIGKELVDCCLAVDDGKIVKIGKEANMPKADKTLDLRKLLVLPGLIDTHVHLRDEGKAYKEDFHSGTAAAAAGGITTVLDMPNNEPVTMSHEALRNRIKVAEKEIMVNVGFYSEFPTETQEIDRIVEEGAAAFKLFMGEQIGGLNVDDDDALLNAFKILSKSKTPLAVHAEDRVMLKKAENQLKQACRNDVEAFNEAHSEEVEVKAINRLIKIAKQSNTKVHFCHISTKKGLEKIIEAKTSGKQITCEVTPHHLFLSAGDVKAGTLALTAPPIREKKHAEALWKGVKNGWIDSLGSDHAPHALEEKKGKTVWEVKVGIPGLETTLPLLLTAVNRGQLSIADIMRLMAEKPAEIFKLKGKGGLKEGNSADLTVVDLHRRYRIDSAKFHSKAKYSPFDGWEVQGKPVKTFVNGQLVMDEGQIVADKGIGAVIRRA